MHELRMQNNQHPKIRHVQKMWDPRWRNLEAEVHACRTTGAGTVIPTKGEQSVEQEENKIEKTLLKFTHRTKTALALLNGETIIREDGDIDADEGDDMEDAEE